MQEQYFQFWTRRLHHIEAFDGLLVQSHLFQREQGSVVVFGALAQHLQRNRSHALRLCAHRLGSQFNPFQSSSPRDEVCGQRTVIQGVVDVSF